VTVASRVQRRTAQSFSLRHPSAIHRHRVDRMTIICVTYAFNSCPRPRRPSRVLKLSQNESRHFSHPTNTLLFSSVYTYWRFVVVVYCRRRVIRLWRMRQQLTAIKRWIQHRAYSERPTATASPAPNDRYTPITGRVASRRQLLVTAGQFGK